MKEGVRQHFNAPTASHYGGVWERMVCSVRTVINTLAPEQAYTEKTLFFLFTNFILFVNSRPGVPNQECKMFIQIFALHYCTIMLSSSCANCSAQSVSNWSMSGARSSIQPEMMLISKNKKRSAHCFVTRIHVLIS